MATEDEGGAPKVGERPRSSTRTRKSLETRQRIMEAATQIIVERGTTAFQMSEVSRGCNMSKGALYYYFSDKEDLVGAIFDEVAQELVEEFCRLAQEDEPPERILRGMCDAFADRARCGTPLAMALVRDLMRSREGVIPFDETSVHQIVRMLAEQFDRAKRAGTVRGDLDSRFAALAVCGGFTFAAMGEEGPSAPDFAEQLLGIMAYGLWSGNAT